MKSFQSSFALMLSLTFIFWAGTAIQAQSPITAPTVNNTSSPLKRGVAHRVFPKNISDYSGTIIFDICIDQAGDLIDMQYNRTASTVTDTDAIADVQDALSQTKFKAAPNAPTRECGQWTMTFQN